MRKIVNETFSMRFPGKLENFSTDLNYFHGNLIKIQFIFVVEAETWE